MDKAKKHSAVRTEYAEDRTEYAEERTDFAEDRTILANERTFASWMRTSIGSVAIAIGAHALFHKIDPAWVPRAIATGFLLIAITVITLAERRAAAVMERLNTHKVESAQTLNLRLFAGVISLASVALIAAIWLADF